MRQKFPGVAKRCAERWTNASQVWDSSLGKFVYFKSDTKYYTQAEVEYKKYIKSLKQCDKK